MGRPSSTPTGSFIARLWPWLALASTVAIAAWHVIDFPDALDPEYPQVVRPTFNRRPPAAYRLAEPGDTLDRVAIYCSAAGIVVAAAGAWIGRREVGLWPAALALALAAFWHASTPGPTFDGWHGLGWRTIGDPQAPATLRIALVVMALILATVIAANFRAVRGRWAELRAAGRAKSIILLLVVALALVLLRQVEVPGVEPAAYWPRCFFDFGLLCFDLAMLKALPWNGSHRLWVGGTSGLAGALVWFALVTSGIWMTWYHRPLERLRTVVRGRIYISAMPTRRGLEIAQARHHFKTIINLFPEDTPLRSPRLPEELRFAKEQGIRYLGSPSDESDGEAFIDDTLAIAQDPEAWPILVHCHGCMDRSPAWMGIYRFVVQGRPLEEIMREIEQHRGHRPKATVTLLYNRVLPHLAPEHYASDPTTALLKHYAAGARDSHDKAARTAAPYPNPTSPSRVFPRTGRRTSLPNLTPVRRSLQYRGTLRDRHPQKPATPI